MDFLKPGPATKKELLDALRQDTTVEEQAKAVRRDRIKRWVADPQINVLIDDISFGEMHSVLDELQDRIDQIRKDYSVENSIG